MTARSFRSDNNAGMCPEAVEAVLEANDGAHRSGYGDDDFTQAAEAAFAKIFGDDIRVYFVATGTAGNCLALASLLRPWQTILTHRHGHLNDDESTAPERFTQCRLKEVGEHPTKVVPADIDRFVAGLRGDVHQPAPGALTFSNASELGAVYTPGEVFALCRVAHRGGMVVHMDGARFANAVASLGCDPKDLTTRAGLDALTFGGTKNGLALGEAVVFFRQGDGTVFERAVAEFEHHRKASGHLLSKHRFLVAPFVRTLADAIWLNHASHANRMARRLAEGLSGLGLRPAYPVQANGVFVALPPEVDAHLHQKGHGYYPFGDADAGLSRLMCSFDTQPEEVDALVDDVREALGPSRIPQR